MVTLSEVSQTDKHHMISPVCGILKNDTRKLTYKTEIDPQTQNTNLLLPKGKGGGRDKLRLWD